MKVWIIGAGTIAREYIKVLQTKGIAPMVITRGTQKAEELSTMFPTVEIVSGGIGKFAAGQQAPDLAIVATTIDSLSAITTSLLNKGCKKILVEKPLTFSEEEANDLKRICMEKGAEVFIAFNRRSYQSVIKAREIIEEDNGVTSFYFDFTEAIFRINPAGYSEDTLKYWGLANSTHVIDTAFYLGGWPQELQQQVSGNSISWHPAGSVFTGSGVTRQGSQFAYHANWGAPGRWKIEINTKKRKLIFSPMEELSIQKAGSFAVEKYPLESSADLDFKPGFSEQVKRILDNDTKQLCSISEYSGTLPVFRQILGYV